MRSMAAEHSNATDPRRGLSLNTIAPAPIAKDIQGTDNSIPLSPQWLLPKPGETKGGFLSGESQFSLHPVSRTNFNKPVFDREEIPDSEKKKDVFRPSVRDAESARRGRWRDEERDTNSAIKRDRWRESEKEHWTDNSSRQSTEARRGSSDRWGDTNNREKNNEQRRESKWNTRWGPDDKEADGWREKWLDLGGDGEGNCEKGATYANNQGNDSEREGDHHSRPWRANSFQSRGRGDLLHPHNATTNKQGPVFSYGRGRGENSMLAFSPACGRVSPSASTVSLLQSFGASENYDVDHCDPIALKYSRIKLLDIYRLTDITNYGQVLDQLTEVSSLTQMEPTEPLALSAPTPEELVILKGIEKGDIVSGVVPNCSKDNSNGRFTAGDYSSRQNKPGSREDSSLGLDDPKDDGIGHAKGNKDHSFQHLHHEDSWSESIISKKPDDMFRERPLSHSISSWRSPSLGERSHFLCADRKEFYSELNSRTPIKSLQTTESERETELRSNLSVSPGCTSERRWQSNASFLSEMSSHNMRRQPSDVFNPQTQSTIMQGQDGYFASVDKIDSRRAELLPSPEDLSLYYNDPQGQIQGPFSGNDLIGWFESGYFGIDLQVRLANSPLDSPFSSLGDVMPHLRLKARPPPGFNTHKQTDVSEMPSREAIINAGHIRAGLGELDPANYSQRDRLASSVEKENRFLESLMSGHMGSSKLDTMPYHEGIQGYINNHSSVMSSAGVEATTDLSYLLAQRLSIEQHRSLSNHNAYVTGREVAPMAPKAESATFSKIFPSLPDARHIPRDSSPIDLLSIPQTASDKPSLANFDPGHTVWPNFSDARIMNNNVMLGGMDLNQHLTSSQVAYAVQQQRLQHPNHPLLSQILVQPADHPSGLAQPEKILSSGLPQDPQVLNLLQQQYLLSQLQMQSQAAVPTQQSLLDRVLLLRQRQEQEQQLLLQRQLLSQVLSEQQSHEPLGEQLHGSLHAPVSGGTVSGNYLGMQQSQLDISINPQSQSAGVQNLHSSRIQKVHPTVSQDVTYANKSEPLLHPFFAQVENSEGSTVSLEETELSRKIISPLNSDIFHSLGMTCSAPSSEAVEMPSVEAKNLQNNECDTVDIAIPKSGSHEPEHVDIVDDNTPDILDNAEIIGLLSALHKNSNDVLNSELASRHTEQAVTKESKNPEGREVKKALEKKSKKQKNLKSQADLGKGSSKETPLQQSKKNNNIQETSDSGLEFETEAEAANAAKATFDAPDPQANQASAVSSSIDKAGSGKDKIESMDIDTFITSIGQSSSHRAWKPAPGLKAKSLLEIQEEEQRRALSEKVMSETVTPMVTNTSTPWVGIVTSSENKINKEVLQGTSSTYVQDADNAITAKNRKSQLHDLLTEEVLSNTNEIALKVADNVETSSLSPPVVSLAIDDDFIEAKESKKSRKKASKGKSGVKPTTPVVSVEIPSFVVSGEKAKASRQAQQERELTPAPPAGPSLGDFVFWKEEQATHVAAPAWSTDSSKLQRPTSLRDILKEQEKKSPAAASLQIPVAPAVKVQPIQKSHGSGFSRQMPKSSPSKGASAVNTSFLSSSLSESKTEDDLFWGPLDQAKHDSKQLSFPFLANSNNRGAKSTHIKGTPVVATNRQNSLPTNSLPTNLLPTSTKFPLSLSPANSSNISSRGRANAMKHTEAVGFRDWCENELLRLTGSKDMSFLEFCLKQSTSEAAMLLKENLGSLDPDHTFIDEFLKYKEILTSEVIEIAFQPRLGYENNREAFSQKNSIVAYTGNDTVIINEESKGGIKKKGKKGKKVSPSVLGFNVVSNRIMMGEIQMVED